MTWVKVLPADPTEEVYFKELVGQTQMDLIHMISQIVGGPVERVFSQTLLEKFPEHPRVVMLVNEEGNMYGSKHLANAKASQYYPNAYGLMIKGNVVLVGEQDVIVDGEPDRIFVDMPYKWRAIYEMELALEMSEYPGQLRGKLEEILLSLVDPDVRKMYEEAREQMDWRRA